MLSLPQLAQAVERNVAQVAARVEQIAPAEMVHLLEGQQASGGEGRWHGVVPHSI